MIETVVSTALSLLMMLIPSSVSSDQAKENIHLYKKVVPSVVFITNVTNQGRIKNGAGYIYSSNGTIVTAAHVVDDALTVTVFDYKDNKYDDAMILLIDEGRDLAIVKIETENKLKAAKPRKKSLKIGDYIATIGHPFNFKFSYSLGVVSQLRPELINRQGGYIIMNAIQTDTALNPGNSGGPIFDMKGKVVGIANVVITKLRGQYSGVAFCTPVSEIERYINGD